jgi:hypothetical protein
VDSLPLNRHFRPELKGFLGRCGRAEVRLTQFELGGTNPCPKGGEQEHESFSVDGGMLKTLIFVEGLTGGQEVRIFWTHKILLLGCQR